MYLAKSFNHPFVGFRDISSGELDCSIHREPAIRTHFVEEIFESRQDLHHTEDEDGPVSHSIKIISMAQMAGHVKRKEVFNLVVVARRDVDTTGNRTLASQHL